MGSKKYFIEKKICKVIELGKLSTSMIFFPKNLNSFIGEYAKNRAKRVNKKVHFPAAPSLKRPPAHSRLLCMIPGIGDEEEVLERKINES